MARAPEKPATSYFHHSRPEVAALFDPRGKRVLELGCATGALGQSLLAKGATEVVGIELHREAAAIARTRLTAVYPYNLSDLPELPYPNGHFDFLVCADVLEHLADPAVLLRQVRRYLRDDARLVVSIPNVRHESVLLPLLVNGRFEYEDAGVLDRTHLRFYTAEELRHFLTDSGFALEGELRTVRSPSNEKLNVVAETVGKLGGDPKRFLDEATVIQYLIVARPLATLKELNLAETGQPVGADPWRGSRPVRVLFVPEPNAPPEGWVKIAGRMATELAANPSVTLGVALPLPLLESPPESLQQVAGTPGLDLLLTEIPHDAGGWTRLMAGASVFAPTPSQAELIALAQSVGTELYPQQPAP